MEYHFLMQENIRYEEAIQCYDSALAIDPNNIEILTNKGASLHKLGRTQEAIQCYDKALAIDPNNVSAFKNKELTYVKLKENEQI
jgi:tetratricopeptide (TPR) repeat protein